VKKDLTISGKIFEVSKDRSRENRLRLQICFDKQVIVLFKEVRNMLALGYHVPHTVTNIAKDARRVYPFAVSLTDTLRTYHACLDLIEANPDISSLVSSYRKEVRDRISRGDTKQHFFVVVTYNLTKAFNFVGTTLSTCSIPECHSCLRIRIKGKVDM
jgi:dynein heavy chain 1